MTILLGIATATSQVGVALAGPEGPLASLQVRQGRRHAELLAPAIDTVAGLAGIGTQQIDRIAVDIGPGLFTGLRVGVATAKALADALDIPIVGCSSLDILAHPHRREGRTVAAVVDAKRGEVFWALYRPSRHGMEPITAATVSAPDELAEALAGATAAADPPVLAVGDGARRYAEVLTSLPHLELAGPADDHPSAAVLVELAADRPSVPLAEITPRYLRGADVRIGWAERGDVVARHG
ncbi:MAG TPA: tRNA (adenosine(37)-N6)-threonylcarbamoyltransferase complex dimerization subunit type 1 TsaB [Acidimicrobiales bacterium]|jgi:tRNA threonylcarbamoyladenosine biosynthesis protein TsaB